MIRVLSVFGTRPEAIKMAPVVAELQRHPDRIVSRVCATAQHREMLDQVLELFAIRPDYDLNIMQERQTLSQLTANLLTALDKVILDEQPDWVLVQGDTTTVLAASLIAFYHRVKVGHVEAGLRTGDKTQPWPEEINRKLCDAMSDLYFAPTETARRHLLAEASADQHIVVTGNTVIDALLEVAGKLRAGGENPWRTAELQGKRILAVTAHRRENFGKPLAGICEGLLEIARLYRDDVHIIYPVHRNPNVQETVYPRLGNVPNITLIDPLDYRTMVALLDACYLVLTDSGGLQEEAPSLGKPVLVLRDVTERPEAVEAGTVHVVGSDPQRIVAEARRLLDDRAAYEEMARAINPYGDGKASGRIVQAILNWDNSAVGDAS